MNWLAEQIKDMVSMADVCEKYGFSANRAGYINCVFHAGDENASLKLYPGRGGFCCFGCGAKGSVIDFVMLLFGEGFSSACLRLNDDFGLGLELGRRRTYRESRAARGEIMARRERMRAQVQRAREVEGAYWAAFDLWRVADMMSIAYAPDRTGGQILSGYAAALRDLPRLADNLTQAEIERWKFEQAAGGPGLGQGTIPDPGTL